jgi:hypothetical protein
MNGLLTPLVSSKSLPPQLGVCIFHFISKWMKKGVNTSIGGWKWMKKGVNTSIERWKWMKKSVNTSIER